MFRYFIRKIEPFLLLLIKKLNEDLSCKTGWSKGLNAGGFLAGMGMRVGIGAAAKVFRFGCRQRLDHYRFVMLADPLLLARFDRLYHRLRHHYPDWYCCQSC